MGTPEYVRARAQTPGASHLAGPPSQLFDLAADYDTMFNQGIQLSGESKDFFMVGRVRDLLSQLGSRPAPERILDFGCGIGDTSRYLAEVFPSAHVVGVDVAEKVLLYAEQANGSDRVSFQLPHKFAQPGTFDLCYVNGVFHHMREPERHNALDQIHDALAPGGVLALFENNPWNLGARLVMARIPFDRDTEMLTPGQICNLLKQHGLHLLLTRSLFYFPRQLAFLRFLELYLARFPFGAQYYVLAVKDS